VGKQALAFCRTRKSECEVVALAVGQEDQGLNSLLKEFEVPEVQAVVAMRDGQDAVAELAAGRNLGGEQFEVDVVLNAITGAVGLAATLATLGETVAILALANKESLVAGGDEVVALLKSKNQTMLQRIIPVDSEHCAIWQCLRTSRPDQVDRLILTASGGPFYGKQRHELENITVDQALAHPTWSMGKVISINSATLMNKALEVVEAAYLFNIPVEKIDVVVHPQSIVHSMVTFQDGSTIAQLSPPSMVLPIALGLAEQNYNSHIERPNNAITPLDFANLGNGFNLEFRPVDNSTFRAIELAKLCYCAGQPYPKLLNQFNEVAVDQFLKNQISFLSITEQVVRNLYDYAVEHNAGEQFRRALNELLERRC
jgi:1-deoxy-D-xylulose-5-phosphate reductoisomerase